MCLSDILASFLISIAASIIAHYLIEWLERISHRS